MRIQLVSHTLYAEPASGAARSVRTVMEILAASGHVCHALTSGRFDQAASGSDPTALHDRLDTVARTGGGARPVVRYRLADVDVTTVETLHPARDREDAAGEAQFRGLIETSLAGRPDLLLAFGGHPSIDAAMSAARRGGDPNGLHHPQLGL